MMLKRYLPTPQPAIFNKLNPTSRCSAVSWTVRLSSNSQSPTSNSFIHPGLESAAFPGQSSDEVDRLLHMVKLSLHISFNYITRSHRARSRW